MNDRSETALDMPTARELMDTARESVRENLPALAREMLIWRDTAVLPDGMVRQIAAPLWAIMPNDALSVVEHMIRDAALEVVADG